MPTDRPTPAPLSAEETMRSILGAMHMGSRHPADLDWLAANGLHVLDATRAAHEALDAGGDAGPDDHHTPETTCPICRYVQDHLAPREPVPASTPEADALREDMRLIANAVLGGTNYLPHREAAERILAAARSPR